MSAKSSIISVTAVPPTTGAIRRGRDPRQVDDERALDFSDDESQRVLTAAASALARELGKQAAREYFAEWLRARIQ